MKGALDGVKFLDLAWVIAGPTIGRVFADYGATVIRVESAERVDTNRYVGPFPQGRMDPQRSALFDSCNSGKLGLCLNLRTEEGRSVVLDLVRWADVVVENFAPGQMAKWGFTPEALLAANSRIVGLSSSLMGATGPYTSLAGYGNTGAAMAGYQHIVGAEGSPPVGPYGAYTDFIAPRYATVAILAALDERRRTGSGCWLDLSQVETSLQFLAPEIAYGAATGHYVAARGNRDPNHAPHGVFRCVGDDRWIAIAVRNDAEWGRLATLLGGEALAPSWASLAGRQADEDRIEALLGKWTAARSAEAAETALLALDIAAHAVTPVDELVDDPQVRERGAIVRIAHPLSGESVVEASRFELSETPARYDIAAPHYGRDTRHVLQDLLSYDENRIERLRSAGALR